MNNTKSFKENYKYNVKKILQITEKNQSKQDNNKKTEKKQEEEKE